MILQRAKTVVIKTWEYNMSYIPVRIIVPWLKWGDNDGNLKIGPLICGANGFHMITASVMKELNVFTLLDSSTSSGNHSK